MIALSRVSCTPMRCVRMLTRVTSWKIGTTKAPPFITTFWPNRPVLTNVGLLGGAPIEPVEQEANDNDHHERDDQPRERAACE